MELNERVAILEYKMNMLMEQYEKSQKVREQMLQNELAKANKRIQELEKNAASSTS